MTPADHAAELAEIAADGTPGPLTEADWDAVLKWPNAIQEDRLITQRTALDGLTKAALQHGRLSPASEAAFRRIVGEIHADLKAHINNIPENDYIAALGFLKRVLYAATGSSGLD